MVEQKASAYCVKCKRNVEIQNPRKITTKNRLVRVAGTCPNCGTKVSRFLGAETPKTPPEKIAVPPKFRPPEIHVLQTDMVGADQFYNELARLRQGAEEAQRVAVEQSLEKERVYVAYSIAKKRADDLSAYRDSLVTAHNELYTRLYERESEITILTERVLVAEKTVAMQRDIIDKSLEQLRAVLPGREFQKYEARIMEMLKASYAMAIQARKAPETEPVEKAIT